MKLDHEEKPGLHLPKHVTLISQLYPVFRYVYTLRRNTGNVHRCLKKNAFHGQRREPKFLPFTFLTNFSNFLHHENFLFFFFLVSINGLWDPECFVGSNCGESSNKNGLVFIITDSVFWPNTEPSHWGVYFIGSQFSISSPALPTSGSTPFPLSMFLYPDLSINHKTDHGRDDDD